MDVEEITFEDSKDAFMLEGSFIDIDGTIFTNTRECLTFFCESQERFMAQRYYQGDGSDPDRKFTIDKAMDFIEQRLFSADGKGPWIACLESLLNLTDKDAELLYILQTLRQADQSLFYMSYKEIHEREQLRIQAKEDRMRLVHSAAEKLTRKLVDNAVAEIQQALKEFEATFLDDKFVGGDTEVSIADFLLAPIVFCLRHRGVARELRIKLSPRIEQWLNDLEAHVPYMQQVFFRVDSENDVIDSLNEYLTERSRPFRYDIEKVEELVMSLSVPAPSRLGANAAAGLRAGAAMVKA